MTEMLEVRRVADHIQRAEALAAARDVSALSHTQRVIRSLLLGALARYRADGRFPKNRDFAQKAPYFIDADGTRCAMAHLMELGGERELVQRIARERNHAYVRDLADEPRVLAWLAAAGLTVEEAAAIQPAYCSFVSDCICGGDFSYIEYPVPARGVLEGVVLANGMLRVDRTYGDALGIEIGNEVAIANTHAAGTLVVAPIDSATDPVHTIALDLEQQYSCQSQGVREAPPLTAPELAQAVLASDCPGELAAMDSAWAKNSCDGVGPDDPDPNGGGDGGGCNAGGADAASVGILLALVTALARRR